MLKRHQTKMILVFKGIKVRGVHTKLNLSGHCISSVDN